MLRGEANGLLGPTSLFFTALWCVLLAAGRSRMFRDPGTFWHIVTGERVLSVGLPRTDWLTFTFAGEPWVAQQWLAECAMALVHRAGGLDALLFATSGVLALTFAWTFHHLNGCGVVSGWSAVITAFAILAAVGSFHVRPLVASMAFFAATYALLAAVERGRARPIALCWLVPLFVVWVNCHGAALGGIATVALFTAIWIGRRALACDSPLASTNDVAVAVLVSVACAATVLVNPYGVDMVRAWSAILSSSAISETVQEHASIVRAGGWYILPFAAWLIVLFATSGAARWRATSILALVWMALAFGRVRHAPFFSIAALVASAELLPRSTAASWLERHIHLMCAGHRRARRFPAILMAAPLAAIFAVSALQGVTGRRPILARLDESIWPTALLPHLLGVGRELGEGAPILNDALFGGFVAFHAPGFRVFSDDRFELYGDRFMAQEATADAEWIGGWVRCHQVAVALVQRGSRLHELLRHWAEWRQVAETRPAILFTRAPADGVTALDRSCRIAGTRPASASRIQANPVDGANRR